MSPQSTIKNKNKKTTQNWVIFQLLPLFRVHVGQYTCSQTAITMAMHFSIIFNKCIAHLHLEGNIFAKFHVNCLQIKYLSTFFGIICCCHGNTLSLILEKVSCMSKPPGQPVCYVSFETLKNCGNSSLGKIIPQNMSLPWQRTGFELVKTCMLIMGSY